MREVGRCNDPKRKQKERVVFVLCLIPVVVVVLLISFLKLVNNTSCVVLFRTLLPSCPLFKKNLFGSEPHTTRPYPSKSKRFYTTNQGASQAHNRVVALP